MVGDWFHIDEAIKFLDDFNETQEPNLFKVVESTLTDYNDLKKVRVECTQCHKWFRLVSTSGNIVSSLYEHMKSKKHTNTTTMRLHMRRLDWGVAWSRDLRNLPMISPNKVWLGSWSHQHHQYYIGVLQVQILLLQVC